MSKFSFCLSYKDILIVKHSLEKRIEAEKMLLNHIGGVGSNHHMYEMVQELKKEHQEHLKCLNNVINEMKHTGRRGCGKENVFGKKYEE